MNDELTERIRSGAWYLYQTMSNKKFNRYVRRWYPKNYQWIIEMIKTKRK